MCYNKIEHIKLYYGLEGDYDTTTAYGQTEPYMSNALLFDAELEKCGSTTPFAYSTAAWYWTGQSYIKEGDSNSGKICRIKVGTAAISVSGAGATNKCAVRCVREVENK